MPLLKENPKNITSSPDGEADFRVGPNRVEHLDGLRGIAALIVVFNHFCAAFGPIQGTLLSQLLANTSMSLLMSGQFCVLIFFVLSGFVLSNSVSKSSAGSLPLLLIARYFRLTVPMVLSLIWGWILLSGFSHSRSALAALSMTSWNHQMFACDMPTLFQSAKAGFYEAYGDVFRNGTIRLNPVIWTMRKELAGSIAIYFVYCLLRGQWRWLGLVIMTILAAAGPVYLGFPIGAIMRELWVRKMLPHTPFSWILLIVGLFIASGNGLGLLSDRTRTAIFGFVSEHSAAVGSVASAMIVFSVLTIPAIQLVLKTSVPQFLGRISFALYLLHLPLLGSVLAWVDLNLSIPFYPKFSVMLIIFLTLAIGAAWLMTITIDEPLIRLLRQMKSVYRETGAVKRPA